MNNVTDMRLYAHTHHVMTGEYTKGMHHRDVSMYTNKKEKK